MADLKIGAVVLAAGSARRFGADKRLQPFAESTVAQTTIEKYCVVFDAVRVVVKDENDPLYAKLSDQDDLDIVFSPDAHLGMGHSLAAGFRELTWVYAFLALADMPLISTETLRHLKNQSTKSAQKIIRPRFRPQNGDQNEDQEKGHPIGFPQSYFGDLATCQGDEGARHILAANSDQISIIDCQDRGVIQDIDTPSALAEAQNLRRSTT